jgi:hypothetical protein
MGLQRQPLVAAAEVLSGGFDVVLPPVTDTLATPRSALRCAGTPAQARSVSFAEGVRGDARECLTRARRERRAERVARRPTRAIVHHVWSSRSLPVRERHPVDTKFSTCI